MITSRISPDRSTTNFHGCRPNELGESTSDASSAFHVASEIVRVGSNCLTAYRQFKALGCAACHQGVNVGANLLQRHGIFEPPTTPERRLLRVPSLRNVAVTAPYFHDGSTPTLDQAVRDMAQAQLGRELSDQQVDAFLAFLRTLTGTFRAGTVAGRQ